MKNKRLFLLSAFLVIIGTLKAQNPIITDQFTADPTAKVFEGKMYVYPSHDIPSPIERLKEWFCMADYHVFSSDNLVDWTDHGVILSQENVPWVAPDSYSMWAPECVYKNGKYYFYFGANNIYHESEVGGIGVAVADRPEGPFKDALGKPLIGKIVNGAQPIDQFVFKDDDGQYYMYYGGWGHCNVVRLNDDFTGLVPFEDGTVYKEVTPDKYVEGPFMFKKNGKYYFMWSEGGWTGPDYCVAYAIADSPFGPFNRIATILQQDSTIARGAGHHSVLHVPNTEDYYIVYHRRPLNDNTRDHRVTCIDRMTFDENGFINPVKMTFEGVPARTIDK